MSYLNRRKYGFLAMLFLPGLTCVSNSPAAYDLPQYYGQVPWASVHRDSRNSDFSPLVTSENLVRGVSVLDGAALINPGVIDKNGNHFVTSARGAGFSHSCPPHKGPSLPGLWQGGLMDEAVIPLFKQIAFGYGVQVANAPAVHPDSGRIFITAAGPKQGNNHTGILYGLDITEAGITTAIELPMGGGSGTSPALSVSGDTVYSADGDGNMLAVDADSGKIRWSAKGEGLLSPAIGPDDTIYTGNIFAAPTVIALYPENGSIKWARTYDDVAAKALPVLEPYAPLVPDGRPVARLVSVISVSANHVWAGMNFGYNYHQPGTGLTLPIPHKSVVCALNPVDGEPLKCIEVRDTVEGVIKIGPASRIAVSHTTIFGSFFYYGVNPSLPAIYRNPVKPVGGMTILQPKSPGETVQPIP